MQELKWIVAIGSVAVSLAVVAMVLFFAVSICTSVGQGEFYFIEGPGVLDDAPPPTEFKGPDRIPQWSKDGLHIVSSFMHIQGPPESASVATSYLVTPNGQRIISVEDAREATISPSGSRIAFTSYPGRLVRNDGVFPVIGTSDINGLNRSVYQGERGQKPTWSPQGDRIAFVRVEPNQKRFFFFTQKPSGIFTIAADGSDLRKIASISIPEDPDRRSKIYSGEMSWSLNETSLYFLNYQQDVISKADADGSNLDDWFVYRTSESEAPYPIRSPLAWSPDGELMAFASFPPNGIITLHIVGKNGSVVG